MKLYNHIVEALKHIEMAQAETERIQEATSKPNVKIALNGLEKSLKEAQVLAVSVWNRVPVTVTEGGDSTAFRSNRCCK